MTPYSGVHPHATTLLAMTAYNAYVPRFPGDFITVDDQALFVRSAGCTGPNDEPAVFIHGLGGSCSNWTELMALLSDRLDSVAPDLPGFGQSPPPIDGDYSPAAQADVIADFVRLRFDGRPVHVFGNSLGGAISVQLAARNPELIRTVTLVSPALPERVPRKTSIHMPVLAVPKVGERLSERMMAKLSAAQRVQVTMDLCYANLDRLNPARFDDAVEEAKEREKLPYIQDALLASLRGLVRTYFDLGKNRPWKLAERITVPVLLVYGRDDKLVNPKAAFQATKCFPNARVVVLPDSGHVSQMEHPELVADAWRELAR